MLEKECSLSGFTNAGITFLFVGTVILASPGIGNFLGKAVNDEFGSLTLFTHWRKWLLFSFNKMQKTINTAPIAITLCRFTQNCGCLVRWCSACHLFWKFLRKLLSQFATSLTNVSIVVLRCLGVALFSRNADIFWMTVHKYVLNVLLWFVKSTPATVRFPDQVRQVLSDCARCPLFIKSERTSLFAHLLEILVPSVWPDLLEIFVPWWKL